MLNIAKRLLLGLVGLGFAAPGWAQEDFFCNYFADLKLHLEPLKVKGQGGALLHLDEYEITEEKTLKPFRVQGGQDLNLLDSKIAPLTLHAWHAFCLSVRHEVGTEVRLPIEVSGTEPRSGAKFRFRLELTSRATVSGTENKLTTAPATGEEDVLPCHVLRQNPPELGESDPGIVTGIHVMPVERGQLGHRLCSQPAMSSMISESEAAAGGCCKGDCDCTCPCSCSEGCLVM